MINLDSEICRDYAQASSREWLETNGIGGFACGTVSGTLTRRYHSYLTTATEPPLGRVTIVSKVEETAIINGEEFELSSNQYPGLIHPEGYRYLESFRLDPFPIWTYILAGVRLEKKLFLVHGSGSLVCQWSVVSSKTKVELKVRPLLSFVDYHQTQRQSNGCQYESDLRQIGSVKVGASESSTEAFFGHNASQVSQTGYWYQNFELEIEKERGFDYTEDLFQPFELSFDLSKPAVLTISTDLIPADRAANLEKSEVKRRKALTKTARVRGKFESQLVLAADQFIVERGEGQTVIAGYPWFSDWGRDTMIALPGLTLAANRAGIAKAILLEFSKHISEGMLPNRFADAGDHPEYNTVDATLWYFEAIRAYVQKTRDLRTIRKNLYAALDEIITWHVRGTRHRIQVDETDGLLYAGESGAQLTWMDAKVGDLVITPRVGKPVEIQALWYNALKVMEEFSTRLRKRDESKIYADMAERCKNSFVQKFWNGEENCLYDVIDDDMRDSSIRPNQIFAVSLYYPLIDGEKAEAVVDKCASELLTPYGLRSLSPRDPRYVPVYQGSPYVRDSAYHQGTVWAWLIGPFIDAYRSVYPDRTADLSTFLSGFQTHLSEAGLGQISEIFDAEPPHTPRGCFAQAWSVAEVLRSLVRMP